MVNNIMTDKAGVMKIDIGKIMTGKKPIRMRRKLPQKRLSVLHLNKIYYGNALDVLRTFPKESINLVITSPPYFNLRNYNLGKNALGNEIDPLKYIDNIVKMMGEVYRVLRKDGSLILNLGDKYYCNSGRHRCHIERYKRDTHEHFAHIPQLKEVDNYKQFKQLLLLPSRIASKMQKTWLLRNEFTWVKPNATPNYAKDRASPSTEKIYHFVKSKKYYYNTDLARKLIPTDVITCNIKPFKKHQASFPEKLVEPFVLCMSQPGEVILDPFSGSGTVPFLAGAHKRNFIGIDLSKQSCQLSEERVKLLYE